jgi:hypothetical protein
MVIGAKLIWNVLEPCAILIAAQGNAAVFPLVAAVVLLT